MARYNLYSGEFICHSCNKKSQTARFYADTKLLTWMCKDSHLSEVDLSINKKKKKDYEREK